MCVPERSNACAEPCCECGGWEALLVVLLSRLPMNDKGVVGLGSCRLNFIGK